MTRIALHLVAWMLAAALAPVAAAAQAPSNLPDDLARLVGPGAVYDADRTRADGGTAEAALEMFGLTEVDGMEYRFWVFRHPGSFDDAVAGLRALDERPMPAPTRTENMGDGLLMFASVLEELAEEIYGSEWLERLEAEAPGLNGRPQRSLSYEIRQPTDNELASAAAGTPVRYVKLDVSAPFLDVSGLRVVDGTYLHLLEVTYPHDPSALAEEDDDDWWGMDEEEAPTAEALGVPLYPGAVYTPDAEYVYSLMSGETGTFRVEADATDVAAFYRDRSGRHCRVDVAEQGDGLPVHELVCLTHAGDEREGDDVVQLIIYALSAEQREELSEEMGVPVSAGTVLIAVDRYEEGAW